MSVKSKNTASTSIGSVFLLAIALLFLLAGCAGKPWTDTFEENEVEAYKSMIKEQIKSDTACPSTLDSEVAITWKTAVQTKSFSGYLQLQLPSSIKFITTNPLGQPLFAVVSDGKVYSSVNALNKQYISGSLSALALRNNIPQGLLTGNWGTWLSGRITTEDNITDIRKDTTDRGLWVVAENPRNETGGKEFILVDTIEKHPILRVLTDANGDPIAQISYGGWRKKGSCGQPTSFDISDLPMGGEITIHLSDIITNKVFTKKNFILMPPRGYFIQLQP